MLGGTFSRLALQVAKNILSRLDRGAYAMLGVWYFISLVALFGIDQGMDSSKEVGHALGNCALEDRENFLLEGISSLIEAKFQIFKEEVASRTEEGIEELKRLKY